MSKESTKEPQEVADFQKELYSLFDSKTASKSKIDKLTKLAFQSAKYYKNIVYCIEKFITRCVPEYKLTGLYVLDSICRTSKSVKAKSSSGSFTGSEYVGRFEKNIEALFAEFCKVQDEKEKEKVKRVVDLWERSGTFAPSVTDSIKTRYFPLLGTTLDDISVAADTAEATEAEQDNAVDKATSIISSLAASLGQTSDYARSPLAATPTSTSSSGPATPSSTTGLTSTPISSLPMPTQPISQNIPSLSAFGAQPSINNLSTKTADNTLLAGLSDPSSAQALQTLLATISQVNAAAAASHPAANVTEVQPPYQPLPSLAPAQIPGFQTSIHDLPPVLQQLQGVLSNSNQNGAFLPNNNTMVSSTVASSSFLHSDPRAGSGVSVNKNTSGMAPTVGQPISGNGYGVSTAPRDPRSSLTDPRLAFLQKTAPGQGPQSLANLPHALPQPPNQPQPQLPPFPTTDSAHAGGFDPRAMAQLASFLNPVNANAPMPSRLPSGSMPMMPMMPMMPRPPLPFLPLPAGQDASGIQRKDLHSGLPSRPGAPETFARHQNEFQGDQYMVVKSPRQDGSEVKEDPTVGPDKIRVVSRTLWVGGTFIPTISEQDLEAIFAPKGQIATLIINQAKFNAFIKMSDRANAERCKADLDRTTVQGEVMKVGWGCGFGPRDCFDYTSGESVIPLDRLTDTDRRWLSHSVVGGFGQHETIRGGVRVFEPNIEAVTPDGREALPRRGKSFGTGGPGGPGLGATATRGGRGGATGFASRGRGRGIGGGMEQQQESHAGGGPRGRGMMMGRGRGAVDEQEQRMEQQRTHPLPHRPSTGFHDTSGPGAGTWASKRDFFPQGPGQGVPGANNSGLISQHSHDHNHEEEDVSRRKKTRWE
ncbi:hypothetical protein BGX28_007861 [Mortierella sp. GBA30]|nr:hypothetical protein BGX28_007861 [Mortierella sp. GBA30]